jgi:hypothetical protein
MANIPEEEDCELSIHFDVACDRRCLSRLGTHYLCGSSEGLDNGLELEVIDEEKEMSDGKAGEAENNGGEVG